MLVSKYTIIVLEKPWTHLMVDLITKLPLVARKDVILVVCDGLSKMTHFVATTEKIMVKRLAQLFRDNIWKLHGLLESIVLDRGPQLATEMMKKLNSILSIGTKLSTLFHPQTDDQTERMNQELEHYLRFFIDHRQKNWPEQSASAEFAINNKAYSTTKVSSFIANCERNLKMVIDIRGKDRESDGVCRKNEESARRGSSSIEESIGGNEATSRQREEKDRSIESREQSNIEYERFDVQGTTSKEASRLICQSIHH